MTVPKPSEVFPLKGTPTTAPSAESEAVRKPLTSNLNGNDDLIAFKNKLVEHNKRNEPSKNDK